MKIKKENKSHHSSILPFRANRLKANVTNPFVRKGQVVNSKQLQATPTDYYNRKGKHIKRIYDDKGERKLVYTYGSKLKKVEETINAGKTYSLPSNTALQTALDKLKETESTTKKDKTGGMHGESALVFKDGTIAHGESGEVARVEDKVLIAEEKLPNLPKGKTLEDVEVSIHSHITGSFVDGLLYYHVADDPSDVDEKTFKQFDANIVVGPLFPARLELNTTTGQKTITKPTRGLVMFDKNSNEQWRLSRSAVEKILKHQNSQ